MGASAAYVDAEEKTDVDVSYCSAYDPDDCGSDGCKCEKTRDGNFASYSRWSCAYDISGKSCEVCYTFDEPQDIRWLKMALYKGDERTRTFEVKLDNTNGVDDKDFEFTSGGYTEGFEYYTLDSDETQELCIEPKGLSESEWFSVIEMEFMVLE
ncbi:unnamed protein product [Sphacelaria rigidula]